MPRILGLILILALIAVSLVFLLSTGNPAEAEPDRSVATSTPRHDTGSSLAQAELPEGSYTPFVSQGPGDHASDESRWRIEHPRSLTHPKAKGKPDTLSVVTDPDVITGTAVVSGWVTVDGQPRRLIEVVAGTESTWTDSAGSFRFDAVPAGRTRIFVRSRLPPGSFSTGEIELVSGSVLRDLRAGELIELQFPVRTFTLKGKLIDSDTNKPIAGHVVLRGEAIKSFTGLDASPIHVLQTTRAGILETRFLPVGKYTLSAFSMTRFSRQYEVSVDQHVFVHDFVLEPSVTVTGEIHSVASLPTTMTLTGPVVRRSKLHGRRFRIRQMIPGHYRVTLHYDYGDVELPKGLTVTTHGMDGIRL